MPEPRLDQPLLTDSRLMPLLAEDRKGEAPRLAHDLLMQARNELRNERAGIPDTSAVSLPILKNGTCARERPRITAAVSTESPSPAQPSEPAHSA